MKAINLSLLIVFSWSCFGAKAAESDYRVATVIASDELVAAMAAVPADSVSDQPISHVESAEGRLGTGVVHRPVIEAGGEVETIQHHKQSEVDRAMAGSGTLVTSSKMTASDPIDPEGYIVTNLTGPSDRGVIADFDSRRVISAGDIVIIPAGVAHGFSDITEAITYMVVRINPERLVELK